MKKNTTPTHLSKKELRIKEMIKSVNRLIKDAKALEADSSDILEKVHPHYRKSAKNLLHYRALRKHDLRDLQTKLGNMGVSRLAKSQTHVMASLLTTRAILRSLLKKTPIRWTPGELSFKKGNRSLKSNAKNLLGYRAKNRRTRIMVTMPVEAADHFQLVKDMVAAGMNCARVNCAHDNPAVWEKIIENVREASRQLGKNCKVAMDLAGPKIRTGPMVAGPKVRRFRPRKDVRGKIIRPLEVWIGPSPKLGFPHFPISPEDLSKLEGVETLFCRDSRNKKRAFQLIKKDSDGYLALCPRTAYLETGLPLFGLKDQKEPLIRVGDLPALDTAIVLKTGDRIRIDKSRIIGEPAKYDEAERLISEAHVSCSAPEVFDQVKAGERILFDDGKIEGRIKKVQKESLLVEVTYASQKGSRLRADKGINFPDSRLTISGLTEKDKKDLEFIAAHADVVNFSFVNRPEDVRELIEALDKLNAKNKLGVILKIETQNGFNQLVNILLEAMHVYPIGVMIARGDLAIETGWNNIGRVQEEILSICQAAHVTDIWATQVLDGLAKKGIPSRAEITDAVMAQRADCVMLNKGPFILEAIRLLDAILKDMEPYREKNAPLTPMMMLDDIPG